MEATGKTVQGHTDDEVTTKTILYSFGCGFGDRPSVQSCGITGGLYPKWLRFMEVVKFVETGQEKNVHV